MYVEAKQYKTGSDVKIIKNQAIKTSTLTPKSLIYCRKSRQIYELVKMNMQILKWRIEKILLE